MRDPDAAVRDPQVIARGETVRLTHPKYGDVGDVYGSGMPIRFSGSFVGFDQMAPAVGQHNEAIYRELLGIPRKKCRVGKQEGDLMRRRIRLLCLAVFTVWLSAAASAQPASVDGRLPSGAAWKIDMPGEWNGALLLFSHGYGGGPQAAIRTATNDDVRDRLLKLGYALAASSYSQTGWSVESAFQDQVALLAEFERRFQKPKRTIAWGTSMGGLVTLGLVQNNPDKFAGGVCLCASVGGSVGMLNLQLDGAFVVRTLLAPDSDIPLVHLTDEAAVNARLKAILDKAAATPKALRASLRRGRGASRTMGNERARGGA